MRLPPTSAVPQYSQMREPYSRPRLRSNRQNDYPRTLAATYTVLYERTEVFSGQALR